MNICTISTRGDYLVALKEISALVDTNPKRGTLDAERLEILGAVLEAYEAKHHPLDSVKDNECYSTGPHSRVPVVNARAPRKVPLISAAQETFYGSLTATDGFTLSNAARMYKQRAWSN